MTINCIDERVKIIKKLWNREHDPHVIDILLKQLKSDIIFSVEKESHTSYKFKLMNYKRRLTMKKVNWMA